MPQWEYKLISSTDIDGDGLLKGKSREGVERYLNELGEQGWEVIAVDFVEHAHWQQFIGAAKRERE